MLDFELSRFVKRPVKIYLYGAVLAVSDRHISNINLIFYNKFKSTTPAYPTLLFQ